MKRAITIGIMAAVGFYVAVCFGKGWEDTEVAILVTYAKRHVANGGVVLKHLPNVTISSHSLKKMAPLFLLGEGDKEHPLKAQVSSEGKAHIDAKAFVERIREIIVQANPEVYIPKDLVSAEFTSLDVDQIRKGQKVLEIYLREAPPAPAASAAGKSTSDVEKKISPVQDSILVQIGPKAPIAAELNRMKDTADTKYLYEKHYHAIPLKVALFLERAGAKADQAGSSIDDMENFYVVRHKTLDDTPQLVVHVPNKGPVAFFIPTWTVGPQQTEVTFDLPAKALIDSLIAPSLQQNPVAIVAATEDEKKETACRRKTVNGKDEIVIEGTLPLGAVAKPTAAGNKPVVFHMDDAADETVVYRAELSIGTFGAPKQELFKRPSGTSGPEKPSTPADLK